MLNSPPTESLSETELEILRLLATGATNREIARVRGISEATVKKHVTNINAKLGTGNRTEAMRRALELGLVSVEVPDSDGQQAGVGEAHRVNAEALTVELEQAHRRSRRLIAIVAVVGLVAVAALGVLAWALWAGQTPPVGVQTPVPTGLTPVTPVPAIWSPGKNLPTARTGLALVAEPGGGGAVLVIGGADVTGVLSQTLRYDPRTLSWEERSGKPTAVRDIGAVAVQGKVVVPGGCRADGQATDVTEIFDLATGVWSAGPRLPRPVCGYALAELDGRIYLFGGRSAVEGAAERWVWSWQLNEPAWSDEPEDMPLPRSDAAAVTVPDQNEIHLLGGQDPSGPKPDHWLFRPFSPQGQWLTEGGAALPQGRAGLGAAFTSAKGPTLHVASGGWDEAVTPWALSLGLPSPAWSAAPALRLALPWRGAPLISVVTQDGVWLATAGGEADGRLLDQYNLLEIQRYSTLYLPIGP